MTVENLKNFVEEIFAQYKETPKTETEPVEDVVKNVNVEEPITEQKTSKEEPVVEKITTETKTTTKEVKKSSSIKSEPEKKEEIVIKAVDIGNDVKPIRVIALGPSEPIKEPEPVKEEPVKEEVKEPETVVEEPVKVIGEVIGAQAEEDEFQLIKPITFSAVIDGFGRVIDGGETIVEESSRVETNKMPTATINLTKFVKGETKPVLINPILICKTEKSNMIDNSELLAKYPMLKNIQRVIRDEGYDVKFTQRSDKLISAGVMYNDIFVQQISFMIDLDGIVLGREAKWFSGFIKPNVKANLLESVFAIRLGNEELLKKFIRSAVTPEELEEAAIYDEEYIAVNDIVNIMSFPEHLNDAIRGSIIKRLYRAIKEGVFEDFKTRTTDRFKVTRYTSPISYELESGKCKVTVGKNTIRTDFPEK